MVAGAVAEAHEVRMAFDEARYHRGAPEIDDVRVAAAVAVTDLGEARPLRMVTDETT